MLQNHALYMCTDVYFISLERAMCDTQNLLQIMKRRPGKKIHKRPRSAKRAKIYSYIKPKEQGCALRKITRSPGKAPNHEILGAQHLHVSLYEKSKFFQSPKDKS